MRFPEQLHTVGHAGRGDLGAQEEGQREHDHRGDRGGQHRVGVDRQTEPVRRRVVADLNAGFGGEDRSRSLLSCLPFESASSRSHRHRSFFITGSAVERPAVPGKAPARTPRRGPVGRKTNAIVSPTTVIANSRVAELTRHLASSADGPSAVIDSTERCTRIALSKPSPRPMPKKTPNIGWPKQAAASVTRPANATQISEQPQRPESNGRKHQRRVLRWRRHWRHLNPAVTRVLSQ